MAQPVKFEISISVTVSEEGVLTPVTKVFVDSEQIGLINRIRVDCDSDDNLPAVEIDMLRGHRMDMVSESVKTAAERYFRLLKRVPGVKCTMALKK